MTASPRRGEYFLRALVALLVAWLMTEPARADSFDDLSPYERETLRLELKARKQVLASNAAGKHIESIEVATLDVLDERDPVPDFFNVFHVTTRERIVRRELLFSEGDRYDPDRVAETARNLRSLKQLSLVLIVPVQGSRPDRVRVLVITKDVWSLRLNTNFEVSNGELTQLILQPSEINLFGTHTAVGSLFILQPLSYSLGLSFLNPRVAGSRIEAGLNGNIIFNRESGDPEGSFGSLFYGQPLYSLQTKWAWSTVLLWREEIRRRYIGSELRRYDASPGGNDPSCTPGPFCIPYEYDSSRWFGAYELTYSLGTRFKHDVSLGVEAYRQVFRERNQATSDPAASAEFRDTQLPTTDTRISPFVQVHAHTSEYVSVLNFNTLGLQEDYQLGHDVVVRVYPASKDVGSNRDLIGSFVAASYTVPLGDGLARALVAHTYEYTADPDERQALAEGGLRLVTPRLGFGRLVYDSVIANRYKNYLRQRFSLGGNTRLRGYPPDIFLGADLVAGTLEFRTRPAEILSAQLGGALFYDVADTFDSFDEMRLHQGAGFGFRILFPQAERVVFRADWGFPLGDSVYQPLPGSFFVTFGQAFEMPQATPPSVATTFNQR